MKKTNVKPHTRMVKGKKVNVKGHTRTVKSSGRRSDVDIQQEIFDHIDYEVYLISDPYEEYELIVLLEDELDIIITDELAPGFRANQMGIYVMEPYNKERLDELREQWKLWLPPNLSNTYITVEEKDGNKYIKYPQSASYGDIAQSIFWDLEESYGRKDNDLTDKQWELLQKTDSWEYAQKQKARIIIANQIADRNDFSW